MLCMHIMKMVHVTTFIWVMHVRIEVFTAGYLKKDCLKNKDKKAPIPAMLDATMRELWQGTT